MLGRDQRERVCPSGNGAWGLRKHNPCLTGEVRGGKRSRSWSEAFGGAPSRTGWGEPKPEGPMALRAPGAEPLMFELPDAGNPKAIRKASSTTRKSRGCQRGVRQDVERKSVKMSRVSQNRSFSGSEKGLSRRLSRGVVAIITSGNGRFSMFISRSGEWNA